MSALEDKLARGEFVVTAEMPVIDGGGEADVRRHLAPMRPYVDAYNATDNPAAHAHCSPLAVAIGLRHAGVEPIMQLVCRDRNRLALEADLAGAAMHGIENICCLTGDDVTAGDEPETKRVFDLDSIQLIALTRSLARGQLPVRAPADPGARISSPARSRTRARRRWITASAARPRRRWPGRASCSCSSATGPSCSSSSCAAARDTGLSERIALIPSICILRSVGGHALRRLQRARHRRAAARPSTAWRRPPTPSTACFELAYELARHAMDQPGVAGLHFISFRKDAGIAALCRRLGI